MGTLSAAHQVASPCCLPGCEPQVSRSGHTLDSAAPVLSLTASWCLWSSLGAEGSPEGGWGVMGGGWVQGQEQSQQGRRKRHFSLGWCSWRGPWPRESSGPAWLQLRRWVVTEDPGGGGQVGTWQHSQGQAGLGARRGLCTRLGHQDGLLPYFQDVC